MKRHCKKCQKHYGTIGAIIHLHTVHQDEQTKESDWQWLKQDIKNREIHDLQTFMIYPFYWFGLVLVAVFDPVRQILKIIRERGEKKNG